jgi:hypothetical protein
MQDHTATPSTHLDRWGKCRRCRIERLLYGGRCDDCWDLDVIDERCICQGGTIGSHAYGCEQASR